MLQVFKSTAGRPLTSSLLSMICCAPVFALAEVDVHRLNIDEPFSDSIKLKLKPYHNQITTLNVMSGAGGHVFDNSKLFPKLEAAILCADSATNAQLLKKLVSNFPNFKHLAIRQNEKLSYESMVLISRLKNLENLGLNCDLADPESFKLAPRSLTELLISSKDAVSWHFANLPHLRLLKMDGPVDLKILSALPREKLEELNIENGLTHEAVNKISSFKNLRFLFMPKAHLTKSDCAYLHSLKIEKVLCP